MTHRIAPTPEDNHIAGLAIKRLFRWDARESRRQRARHGRDHRPKDVLIGTINRACHDMMHFGPAAQR